jgi:hypothetical protein
MKPEADREREVRIQQSIDTFTAGLRRPFWTKTLAAHKVIVDLELAPWQHQVDLMMSPNISLKHTGIVLCLRGTVPQ